MRVLHLADFHIGKPLRGLFGKNYTYLRLKAQREALFRVLEYASSYKPDLILVSGDVMDSPSPSTESEEVAFEFLREAGSVAPVVLIPGNHDSHRRLRLYSPFFLRFNVHIISPNFDSLQAILKESILLLGDVIIVAVPFLSPSRLKNVRVFSREDDEVTWASEQVLQTYSRVMSVLLKRLREETKAYHGRYLIFLLHTFVQGATLSGSEYLVMDWGILAGDLPDADYIALGHIHNPQRVSDSPLAVYSGSPYPLDFGDSYRVSYISGNLKFEDDEFRKRGFYSFDLDKRELKFHLLDSYKLFTLDVAAEDLEKALLELRRVLPKNERYWVRVRVRDGKISLKRMEELVSGYEELLRIEVFEERKRLPSIGSNEGDSENHLYNLILSPMESYKMFYRVQKGKEPEKELLRILEEIVSEVLADDFS